jgi:hypothetical protein
MNFTKMVNFINFIYGNLLQWPVDLPQLEDIKSNKRLKIPKWQSKMDNIEKLAT